MNPAHLEGRGKDDGTSCRVEGRARSAKSLLCPVFNFTKRPSPHCNRAVPEIFIGETRTQIPFAG
jgi:hypothetical protein